MGLTAGKIPKAASADHIIDGYDTLTAVGTPGVDTAVVTDKAVRDALNLKAEKLHASNHTDGTDDIQDATAAQKGLATAAQITKLDGIEPLADVTDATNVASAGAVMQSLATAKGDILVATGANALSRLAVGTNNELLIADSSQPSGMKWIDDEVETWFSPGTSLAKQSNVVFTKIANSGGFGYVFFNVPFNYKSMVAAELIISPYNNGASSDLNIDLSYGTIGETMNQHSASDTTSTYNLVKDIIFALDISPLLGSLAVNDFVSVRLKNNESFKVRLYGLRFRYLRTKE